MRFIRVNGRVVPIRDSKDNAGKKERIASAVARTAGVASGAALAAGGISSMARKAARSTSLVNTGLGLGIAYTAIGLARDIAFGKRFKQASAQAQNFDEIRAVKKDFAKENTKRALGDIASFGGGFVGMAQIVRPSISQPLAKAARKLRTAYFGMKTINPEAAKSGVKVARKATRGVHVRHLTKLLGGKTG